jgi:hypothetical protein
MMDMELVLHYQCPFKQTPDSEPRHIAVTPTGQQREAAQTCDALLDFEAVALGILLHAQAILQLLFAGSHHLQLLVIPTLLRTTQAFLHQSKRFPLPG